MRIAQVAPLSDGMPPKFEDVRRLVYGLTKTLAEWGCDVTLFAGMESGGPSCEPARSEVLHSRAGFVEGPITLLLERAFFSAHEFDLVHSHVGVLGFPYARCCPSPVLSTMYRRLDGPIVRDVFDEFSELPLVSLLTAQRRSVPSANWVATIHGALHDTQGRFRAKPGAYLAFYDRLSPDTNPAVAVKLAHACGWPLRLMGTTARSDLEYFQRYLCPLSREPGIDYVGNLNDDARAEFLGSASALVVSNGNTQPYSFSVIEALACGTPVLILGSNPASELVEDGVTGFVCRTFTEMAEAIGQLSRIDRRRCRESFEARFTVDRTAAAYLHIYERMIESRCMKFRR
jgi:glycosyltransferase involved in cell wall biosynthesis